ncbi:hypothetical protein T484DRAFT_1793789 [Baffinella frigidus]|nr:hypothetical protein T484DRAFT_1793789 [Cryptophyta sp. CCMP2293]|mmetsp:Transcript_1959/g.4553  ORF Transcript_1959/g.4553 Transcript_1959/m.4553 type:complete len:140 (+) Transcript_1959:68-487(+)
MEAEKLGLGVVGVRPSPDMKQNESERPRRLVGARRSSALSSDGSAVGGEGDENTSPTSTIVPTPFGRLSSSPNMPTSQLEKKSSWRRGMLEMKSCPAMKGPSWTGEDERMQSVRQMIALRMQPAPPKPRRHAHGGPPPH